MKGSVAAIVALVLLHGGAVFGNNLNPFSNNDDREGRSDLTNVLECAEDAGQPFNVPLIPPTNGNGFDNDYWTPATSG